MWGIVGIRCGAPPTPLSAFSVALLWVKTGQWSHAINRMKDSPKDLSLLLQGIVSRVVQELLGIILRSWSKRVMGDHKGGIHRQSNGVLCACCFSLFYNYWTNCVPGTGLFTRGLDSNEQTNDNHWPPGGFSPGERLECHQILPQWGSK